MAKAITEGLSNENGSLLEEMCDHCYGLEFFLESEDEDGPSPEGEVVSLLSRPVTQVRAEQVKVVSLLSRPGLLHRYERSR